MARQGAPPGRDHQQVAARAIRAQQRGQHAGRPLGGAQQHRARAIAKEHTGGAILPVDHCGSSCRPRSPAPAVCSPEAMACWPMVRAYTNPEQPALRSNAPACIAPRAFCTWQAVAGISMIGRGRGHDDQIDIARVGIGHAPAPARAASIRHGCGPRRPATWRRECPCARESTRRWCPRVGQSSSLVTTRRDVHAPADDLCAPPVLGLPSRPEDEAGVVAAETERVGQSRAHRLPCAPCWAHSPGRSRDRGYPGSWSAE